MGTCAGLRVRCRLRGTLPRLFFLPPCALLLLRTLFLPLPGDGLNRAVGVLDGLFFFPLFASLLAAWRGALLSLPGGQGGQTPVVVPGHSLTLNFLLTPHMLHLRLAFCLRCTISPGLPKSPDLLRKGCLWPQ